MSLYRNVSIIIPTYNRAHYLRQCVEACLAQTVPCEVIICDHGSTDDTPGVAASFGDRVSYIRRARDFGVHFCWLDGILHARHELIHLNFDDDWIEPDFIEKCLALFTDEVGCVLSNAKIYFEAQGTATENAFNLGLPTGIHSARKLAYFNARWLTSPGAGIYRKTVLLDNLFMGRVPFARHQYHGVGPDILFSLMSTLDYRYFGFVNEPLAVFRAHANSITIDAAKDAQKQKKIQAAYAEARLYYFLNRFHRSVSLRGLARISQWAFLLRETPYLSRIGRIFGTKNKTTTR